MVIHLEILAIACLISLSAALLGVFLVLRGVALMSDAVSHAILPGIAIAFLFVQQLNSPLLIIGAASAGLCTVFCSEWLIRTNRLKKDAAIGLVFPLFFSIGVIIISKYVRNIHIDADIILLGELAFAPFNRLGFWGFDLGPVAFWAAAVVFFLNSAFIFAFYKELVISTFDQELAYVFGFAPAALYYTLMSLTSITAVVAFDAVGSIVIVALMIIPPATAYIVTRRLHDMLLVSIILSLISPVLGYYLAAVYDVSIAGSIAVIAGMLFLCAFICSPYHGPLHSWVTALHYTRNIKERIVCLCLAGVVFEKKEVNKKVLLLGWTEAETMAIVARLIDKKWLYVQDGCINLTALGKKRAHEK